MMLKTKFHETHPKRATIGGRLVVAAAVQSAILSLMLILLSPAGYVLPVNGDDGSNTKGILLL